jgi:uncharacterized membrane protein (DUF4010 family)
MSAHSELLLNLITALAIGLLIGAERSWSARDGDEEKLSAGLRTFGLVGLLGGLAVLLAGHIGVAAWVAMLAALAVLVTTAYFGDLRRGEQGLTSEIALLLTFLLGSLALTENRVLAGGSAVVIALLLRLKEPLHTALKRLSGEELSAALKLLFISIVMLPVLPNRGYGPWEFFNPYAIWWMVVLITALNASAYTAMRLVGARHGLLLTSLLGGIVSSTVMTLTLARLHERRELFPLLAAGLLATSALMFPRVLLEVAAINRSLLPQLLWPLLGAALVYAGGAIYWWRRATADREQVDGAAPALKNPFEIGPALRFGLLLTAILLLVEAGRRTLGDAGIYLVALLSGVADVDAITLSLSRAAAGELQPTVAATGITLAAVSNSVVKAALIALVGGRQLALRTLPIMAAGLALALLLVGLI